MYLESEAVDVTVPVKEQNGANFLLDDGVNTNIYLDKNYSSDYTVEFNYNTASNASMTPSFETETYSLSELTKYEDESSAYNGCYVKSFEQAPAQLGEPIDVTIKNGNDVIKTFTVNPAEMCKAQVTAINAMEPEEVTEEIENLKELYMALVDYAYAAQEYFGYSIEDAPISDGFYNDVEGAVITAPEKSTGVPVSGVSIVVVSKLGINLYTDTSVTVSSATIGSKELTVDSGIGGTTGRQVITVRGIDAADLGKNFTITTDKGDIVVSAYAVALAISNADVSDNYKNLAKALYLYGEAADTYFA